MFIVISFLAYIFPPPADIISFSALLYNGAWNIFDASKMIVFIPEGEDSGNLSEKHRS